MLWQRFGDGKPLGPRHFDDACRALGDAMAARQFEIDMMRDAHIAAQVEIAQAQRRSYRGGRYRGR